MGFLPKKLQSQFDSKLYNSTPLQQAIERSRALSRDLCDGKALPPLETVQAIALLELNFREAAAVMAEALPDLIHWAKRGLEDIESVTASALLETAITRAEIAIAKTNALFEEAPHD